MVYQPFRNSSFAAPGLSSSRSSRCASPAFPQSPESEVRPAPTPNPPSEDEKVHWPPPLPESLPPARHRSPTAPHPPRERGFPSPWPVFASPMQELASRSERLP